MQTSKGEIEKIKKMCQDIGISKGKTSDEFLYAICGLRRTVLRSKTDAMRSERTDLI